MGLEKIQTTKETITSSVTSGTSLYEPTTYLEKDDSKKGKGRVTNSSFPCHPFLLINKQKVGCWYMLRIKKQKQLDSFCAAFPWFW